MKTLLILIAVVAAYTFPYYKMPHTWREVFTTRWW